VANPAGDRFLAGRNLEPAQGWHPYAQRTSISSIRDRDGSITHFIGLFSDVTALKNNQEQLEKMAYYDALTGLPNRCCSPTA
jgi:hypothetical protein